MTRSASAFFRRHTTHDEGLFSALVAGVCLAVSWADIVVLLHQFEEYRWPGGLPAVANLVLMSTGGLSRIFKPLNQLSSGVANCLFAYVFYLMPVFFPQAIWLGLAPVVVGPVIQTIGHVIVVNYRIRSLYSPALQPLSSPSFRSACCTSTTSTHMAWPPPGPGSRRSSI
jgi:hypothetical protein